MFDTLVGIVGAIVLALAGLALVAYLAWRAVKPETTRERINASPDHIWKAITDYEQLPHWLPEIERVELRDSGGSGGGREGGRGGGGWVEYRRDGSRVEYDLDHVKPPSFIQWRYRLTPPLAKDASIRGRWSLRVAADSDDACDVVSRHREDFANPVIALLRSLHGPASWSRLYLECLREHVEAAHAPGAP